MYQDRSDVVVDFLPSYDGWLEFSVTVGEQSYHVVFPELWDPTYDFLRWLEAIALGVHRTSFTYDAEGPDILFDFRRRFPHNGILQIGEPDEDESLRPIHSHVDKKQMVEAFYCGMREFAQSEKYNPMHWQSVYMREELCKKLNVTEEELIEQIINLDRVGVREFFFKHYPLYTRRDLDTELIRSTHKVFYTETKRGREDGIFPIKMDIPKEYDNWSSEERKTYIHPFLHKNINGYRGMRLSEFQSDIVDRYLKEGG